MEDHTTWTPEEKFRRVELPVRAFCTWEACVRVLRKVHERAQDNYHDSPTIDLQNVDLEDDRLDYDIGVYETHDQDDMANAGVICVMRDDRLMEFRFSVRKTLPMLVIKCSLCDVLAAKKYLIEDDEFRQFNDLFWRHPPADPAPEAPAELAPGLIDDRPSQQIEMRRAAIKDLLSEANYTDFQLSQKLHDRGIETSPETVKKDRQAMRIRKR